MRKQEENENGLCKDCGKYKEFTVDVCYKCWKKREEDKIGKWLW